MAADPTLPKRFQPLLAQALNEAAIRYGGQETALAQILGQTTRNYNRQSQAQAGANSSLLGALKGGDQQLTKVYSDAGLTPDVLAQIGNSPTGQRLAGELASGRADLLQNLTGAQAGGIYQQQHLGDQYHDDVADIGTQLKAEQTERGQYTSGLLDKLIGDDRSARHDANLAASKQQHDDAQAALDRSASTGNTALSSGYTIDAQGNLVPIPGGKADPSSKPRKKPTTGPGSASADAQRTAGTDFKNAYGTAATMAKGEPVTPDQVRKIANALAAGRPAGGGKVIYDEVPDPTYANPNRTKRVPRVEPAKLPNGKPNPKAGQQILTPESAKVDGVDRPVAQAAAEMAVYGYVTTATVRDLQALGYSVNQIPGLTTQNQHRTTKSPTTQRTAPPGTSIRDIYG